MLSYSSAAAAEILNPGVRSKRLLSPGLISLVLQTAAAAAWPGEGDCARMGSLCTSRAGAGRGSASQAPADLAELLQQAERDQQKGRQHAWLEEFQLWCVRLDSRAGLTWRANLLQFLLDCRAVLKPGEESGAATREPLLRLAAALPLEGGVALSDSNLRSRLSASLAEYQKQAGPTAAAGGGAAGTRAAMSPAPTTTTVAVLLPLVRQAYLDSAVWDRMEKLYLKFLEGGPSLPALAVLLSIL